MCTGSSAACASAGLPNRYISGVKIDTVNPSHAYLALSGYSRKWMIGFEDPGVGHLFQTTTGGATWSDVSANLPDLPMDDVVFDHGNLIVAADDGVCISTNNGASWNRLGTNLPNVVVDQLTRRSERHDRRCDTWPRNLDDAGAIADIDGGWT